MIIKYLARNICLLIVGIQLSTVNAPAFGKDIIASIAVLPVVAETPNKGVFVDLVKALNKEYKNGTITFELYPFKRSLTNVAKGRADFHLPFMKSSKGAKALSSMGLAYALERSNRVPFALYYNVEQKVLNGHIRNNFSLKDIGQYKIETDSAHVMFFDDIPIRASTCLECSIKKLSRGRIDGFIFAGRETDYLVEKLGIKNIDSFLIKNFDSAPVFRTTPEGRMTNQLISNLIKKLRDSGELARIMKPYTEYYRIHFGVDAL